MGFLSKIAALFMGPALDWLYKRIAKAISAWIEQKRLKEEREKKNAKLVSNLKAADTKEERDEAARDIIRND